jgi:hypothetical protein
MRFAVACLNAQARRTVVGTMQWVVRRTIQQHLAQEWFEEKQTSSSAPTTFRAEPTRSADVGVQNDTRSYSPWVKANEGT